MIEIKHLPKKDYVKVKKYLVKLLAYEHKNFDKNIRIDRKGQQTSFRNMNSALQKHKGALFVAVEGARIIGYAMGIIIKKSEESCKWEDTGFLDEVFVEERYRNKGIGSRLVKAMIGWFRKNKIKIINIQAYAQNLSINLYRKLGFKDKSMGLRLVLK
jgi:GNAT superfamily N-acetyltransferase